MQTTVPISGKIVNSDDTILPIDGSVLVGKDNGAYMNLETGSVLLECYSAQPSSTPDTWTCVPSQNGSAHIVETFVRVHGGSDRCDLFAKPDIPHPVDNPPLLPPKVSGINTCTDCAMLDCLLNPQTVTCPEDQVCGTTVQDLNQGRQIRRQCIVPPTTANPPQCAGIETHVLPNTADVCTYACDGNKFPTCNRPPQLLPATETLIPVP